MRKERPRTDRAVGQRPTREEWQIEEILAGIAELDAGEIVTQEEAKERYKRLLRNPRE